jgi:hypothetical protein
MTDEDHVGRPSTGVGGLGEALLWSGNEAGAQKQFDKAATLYLTPSEKKQLAKFRHG